MKEWITGRNPVYEVLAAHHHFPSPAERRDIRFQQHEPAFIQLFRPAHPDQADHLHDRCQIEDQRDQCARGIQGQQDRIPGERRRCSRLRQLRRLRAGRDHRQVLDADGRRLDGPQPERRQQQAQVGSDQQEDAVQPVELGPAHDQQEKGVEQSQIETAPDYI